jgi:uncharacterized membrane protein YhaH (DUF805 family)
MKWYFQVLRKYAVFGGRASRKEFWLFSLIYLAVLLVLTFIDFRVGTFDHDYRVGLASGLYEFATLLPVIAVSVRRLHDTNRSAWWYFIVYIPVAGIILFLFFMAQDSQPGENRYGPSPKPDLAGTAVIQNYDI